MLAEPAGCPEHRPQLLVRQLAISVAVHGGPSLLDVRLALHAGQDGHHGAAVESRSQLPGEKVAILREEHGVVEVIPMQPPRVGSQTATGKRQHVGLQPLLSWSTSSRALGL